MGLSIELMDDGTLDTVVNIYCPKCDQRSELRFSDVDRDPDGGISVEGWRYIEESAMEWHTEDAAERGECGLNSR